MPNTDGGNSLESQIQSLGQEIWVRVKGQTPGVFDKDYWQGRLIEWAMQDASFKVDLFRFVDVLPTLTTKEQVASHVEEYLLKPGRSLPLAITAALKAATGGLTAGLAAAAIRKNVTDMAERFIVGADPKSALPLLAKLHKRGLTFTVDLLGEASVSETEAEEYVSRYSEVLEVIHQEAQKWGAETAIEHNHVGPIPRVNLSVKISSMYSQIDPVDHDGSVERLYQRILPLFLRAKESFVFLNLDLEQSDLHNITYDLFERLVTHESLISYPHVGIVVQAYLREAPRDVERLKALSKRRGTPLTVRLVKGAYWDYETVLAKQRGWPCPVLTEKAATDAQYEAISETLLSSVDHLWPAFGSHNLRSLTHAVAFAKARGVPQSAYEIQMLHGMAEPERDVFAAMGARVRVYAPVGALLPGMAYLVRRLLENTSNQGFLRLSHHDGKNFTDLFAPPLPSAVKHQTAQATMEFHNFPLADFSIKVERDQFQKAVAEVSGMFPIRVPVVIAGEKRVEGAMLTRECPSESKRMLAEVVLATKSDVERAVVSADAAWPKWREKSVSERAELLRQLADRLAEQKYALAALMTWESGKPWKEADADVAEAIDFCRYYAERAMVELVPNDIGTLPGEDNKLFYEGRGVAVVIAPWNFPLAILCGMAVAALVAGNTVVIKPAEQSSAIAFRLFEAMIAVGIPRDVVHFMPGLGEEVGAALVEHPHVATIAFTGSRSVGLHIVEKASRTQEDARQVKRVVCEMGGKNAIIVDDDADMDEAVLGVVRSAFGYAGQKCSACSRVLVHSRIYENFVNRLVEATKSLTVDAAHSAGTSIGPVIDAEAYARLKQARANLNEGAEMLFESSVPSGGYFVPATIVAVTNPMHPLMQEELFGPVLAVFRVNDFDHALEVANNTRYALTGAVYSRSPGHIEKARAQFRVGNLYINRGSTGAMVGRQPFGGFQMSGLGSKAGGPHYLLHFTDPRCVTENTMRRGFTPDES